MPSPNVRMASDYNRGLTAPVRWGHVVCKIVHEAWRGTFGNSHWGRWLAWPICLALAGYFLVQPFDAAINRAMVRWADSSGGDLRRELHAWQQYGQGLAMIIVALAVMLHERERRVRLWDLALAAIVAKLVAQGAKMLIGRPRPRPQYEDATTILGPFGEYPIVLKDGTTRLVHAWDTSAGAGTDLWSMPSSHTLFAAVLSVFLAQLYPRLTPLLVVLTLVVAAGRVMFDAHWATDVIVGGLLGWGIGSWVIKGQLGLAVGSRVARLISRRA